MILDYTFNSKQRELDISYIEDTGNKKLLKFNVSRFKTFYYTPRGQYQAWNGARCDEKFTEKPCDFDIKTFLMEMDERYRQLIQKKTFPKVYTWDIEVAKVNGEYAKAEKANAPITTISVVNPQFDAIVLSTGPLTGEEEKWCAEQFKGYLDNTEFFRELKLDHTPTFKYIRFDTESDMLTFFLREIVAKVPILAGWNSILFDWQYLTNRIINYYPNISLNIASCTGRITRKKYTDLKGEKYTFPMPEHTLILDMMDVIKNEDFTVLPIKESMGLDYISFESMGINKIAYDGDLDDLRKRDFPKYVYYNTIDSILVQLIDHKFKTLDHIYFYSLRCMEKIGKCFSKIATTQALVFQDFYKRGLKIVYEEKEEVERGKLIGAYVKIPITGIHEFVCCNDFASLYPSTIRTCNLSFENFIGNRSKFTERQLEQFRKDPNFFVSVNGNVYKNDQDYSFRRIQADLKANRDESKYLGKRIDAEIMLDIEHVLKGIKPKHRVYDEKLQQAIANVGAHITCSDELQKYDNTLLKEIYDALKVEVVYYDSHQYAMKLLMNSMYGGCSHVSFYWYNMDLANDVTGESRNLIHMMEHHIPAFWRENWLKMTELHKILGIEIDPVAAKAALESCPVALNDPDAYHEKSFVYAAYGDTDSLYLSYAPLMKSIKGYDQMTTEQKRDILVKLNTGFLDKHNEEFIRDYYNQRYGTSVHDFELEIIMRSGVWLDVKKRYAGLLLWKDGKSYDVDSLPMKIKGLEMVKRSFPKRSREQLKDIVRYLLETSDEPYLSQRLNMRLMKLKSEFMEADIDEVSGSVKVNGYTKHILSTDGQSLQVKTGCPWNSRALGYRNWLIDRYHLDGEKIFGGMVKWYVIKDPTKGKKDPDNFFAYQAQNWDKWAERYAPIDRRAMFQKTVLDPFNRIIEPNGIPKLSYDGNIQFSLF